MDTKKATNKQTTAAIASARQIPPIKRIFLITSRLSPSDRQLFSSHRPWVETRSLPTLTRSSPRRFTFYVADPSAPFTGLHRFDYIGFRRREQDEVHEAAAIASDQLRFDSFNPALFRPASGGLNL